MIQLTKAGRLRFSPRKLQYEIFCIKWFKKIQELINYEKSISVNFLPFKIKMFVGLHAIEPLGYRSSIDREIVWDRIKRYYLYHKERIESKIILDN